MSMGQRSALGMTVAAVFWTAAALADGSASAESGEAARRRLAGDYLFIGGTRERSTVPAAVDRSVDGMFFLVRGIAYDRLMRSCEICNTYTVSFTDQVTVAGPCQIADVSPADGSEVDHRTKYDETSKLSQRIVDGALVQYFRGEEGARRVVWTLDPDGATLHVQVVISSKHLPHPVDYTLTYRRKGGAAPAGAGADGADAGQGPPG